MSVDLQKPKRLIDLKVNYFQFLNEGNLFFCYTGHFMVDFNPHLFPNDDYRKRFLRLYLEEKNKLNNVKMNKVEFDEQLALLFHQTGLFSLSKLLNFIVMLPMIDLQPDFFKSEGITKANKLKIKYFNGKFGYEVRCTMIHSMRLFAKLIRTFLNLDRCTNCSAKLAASSLRRQRII